MNEKYLETIRAINGEVFHLEYHQQRLNFTLNSLSSIHKLKELLNPPKTGIYRCRVLYNKEEVEVEYVKYVKRHIRSLKLVYDDEITYSKKYEDRTQINKLLLQKDTCDDILIVKNSLVTDTSIANIAFYNGVSWLTPKTPLLMGTTRERLLRNRLIIEKDIKPSDIKTFQKVALMNAMIDFDIIAKEKIGEIIC